METSVGSWILAFFFLATFAFLAGFFVNAKTRQASNRATFGLAFGLMFCLAAALTVLTIENTIRSVRDKGVREGISQRRVDELLDNRWLLASGWYEVVEPPLVRPIFSARGDSTQYIRMSIRSGGIQPFEVAFPMKSWNLKPPMPEVKWLGERWTLVSPPQPQPKAIRVERYEGSEYGYEPRVIEVR